MSQLLEDVVNTSSSVLLWCNGSKLVLEASESDIRLLMGVVAITLRLHMATMWFPLVLFIPIRELPS